MPHPSESHSPVRNVGELKAMRFDEATQFIWYWGYARVASSTSADVWQIRRITAGPGGDLVVEWANGNAEFMNSWDNRASYNYS